MVKALLSRFKRPAGDTASGSAATSGTLNSFGRIAIGSNSFVLPLRFLNLAAIRENASVKIKWQTANELSVQNYQVQRSTDGISFSAIATIQAKNSDLQTYQYTDNNVCSSKLYYRILSSDLDGRTRYSNMIVVTSDNIQKIEVLTNPVKDVIQLSAQNLPVSVYSYQLVNSNGQVCKKGSFSFERSSVVYLSVPNVASGLYTLILSKPRERRGFPILVN